MNIKLITFLAITFCFLGSNANQLNANKKSSYFEQVIEWHKQGEPVSFDDIRGYKSGLCFLRQKQNKAFDASFGIDEISPAGPGFKGERYMALFRGHHSLASMKSSLRNWVDNYSVISETATEITAKWDLENNGRWDTQISARKYKDFIVTTETELIGQTYHSNYLNKEIFAKKNTIQTACYMFDDVVK